MQKAPPRNLFFSALVTNPYIPHEAIEISPGVKVSGIDGLADNAGALPGVFVEISSHRCTADGGLLIQGSVGRQARDSLARSTHATGCWRVSPEGAVTPASVIAYQGSHSKTHCDLRSFGRDDPKRWQDALKRVDVIMQERLVSKKIQSEYKSSVEDPHGNIWISEACGLHKFSRDGQHEVVIDDDISCSPKRPRRTLMRMSHLAYDRVADELVFATDFYAGAYGGYSGVWRLGKDRQYREVARWSFSGPPLLNPKQMLGNGDGPGFMAVDSKGRIWFGMRESWVAEGPQSNRVYRTLPGADKVELVINDIVSRGPNVPGVNRIDYRDGSFKTANINNLFGASCFDPRDNLFVAQSTRGMIRKIEQEKARIVTWVH